MVNISSPHNIYFNKIWYFKNKKRKAFFTLQKDSQPGFIMHKDPLEISKVITLIKS